MLFINNHKIFSRVTWFQQKKNKNKGVIQVFEMDFNEVVAITFSII